MKDVLELTSLGELQAVKWFLLHERNRHLDDIKDIDKDLAKLTNVALPQDVIDVLDWRFEIPVNIPKNTSKLTEGE